MDSGTSNSLKQISDALFNHAARKAQIRGIFHSVGDGNPYDLDWEPRNAIILEVFHKIKALESKGNALECVAELDRLLELHKKKLKILRERIEEQEHKELSNGEHWLF